MRILVTGADGFVGEYLAKELKDHGHEVFRGLQRIAKPIVDRSHDLRFDLADESSVIALIEQVEPDRVIHLAAQSSVQESWKYPGHTMEVNLIGTVRLIEAVGRYAPRAHIITIGSGEEYGLTASKVILLQETDPCAPMNPYAVSKYAAGLTGGQMALRYNLHHIHIRSFNHYGPGQRKGFVVSDFASRIARIEAGLQPPIMKVGNLSAQRDFTHVSDVVRAYRLLAEENVASGIFNVCSGIARPIQEILNCLLQRARVSIDIQVDAALNRPAEIPVFAGSPMKINQAIRWVPHQELQTGLEETLNWWRARLESNEERLNDEKR